MCQGSLFDGIADERKGRIEKAKIVFLIAWKKTTYSEENLGLIQLLSIEARFGISLF